MKTYVIAADNTAYTIIQVKEILKCFDINVIVYDIKRNYTSRLWVIKTNLSLVALLNIKFIETAILIERDK